MAAILRVKDENGNIVSIPAIKGDKGEKGDRGLPGSGGVPDGGTTGQVLTKNSNSDGDAGWKDTEHDLFNANGKTYEEVIYAYESGKVCYLTYAGTKLLNNGYSGNRNPFKFSGENSNGEILTATLSYDNTLTFGDRGDYQITTASQTLSKEKQSQALTNIGGLSKNQGIDNSGKFLGIGADGIVVPTEVSGGDKWELISHSDTPIENVAALKINLDDNGNAFQLKKAVLYLWCSVNGNYAYANIGKASGYSWLCTINGSGQEKLYTVKYFKDVDGQWCVGANMVSYNTTTMLPTSQEAFRYGRRVTDTTEYCDYIHFEKGLGASFAKYALYGVRK